MMVAFILQSHDCHLWSSLPAFHKQSQRESWQLQIIPVNLPHLASSHPRFAHKVPCWPPAHPFLPGNSHFQPYHNRTIPATWTTPSAGNSYLPAHQFTSELPGTGNFLPDSLMTLLLESQPEDGRRSSLHDPLSLFNDGNRDCWNCTSLRGVVMWYCA